MRNRLVIPDKDTGMRIAYTRREFLAALHRRQHGRCIYCNCPMILTQHHSGTSPPPNSISREHIIPRSPGGRNLNNIVAACTACNTRRGTLPWVRYLALTAPTFVHYLTSRIYLELCVCTRPPASSLVGTVTNAVQLTRPSTTDDGHLITVGPTGGGKGVSAAIPALLSWPGPAIIIDPKAEAFAITATYRRSLGQRICVLDPFNQTRVSADTLNPLQLVSQSTDTRAEDAVMLATVLADGVRSQRDPFWDDRASALIAGLTLALMDRLLLGDNDQPLPYTLSSVRSVLSELTSTKNLTALHRKDDSYPIPATHYYATQLSRSVDPDIAAARSILFTTPRTLSGIISTAATHMSFLRGGSVARTIASSSIELTDITAGLPMTLYIIIPPDKLRSHNRLLRMWLAMLITTISRRTSIPAKPTLMLVDEAAQLGHLPQLLTANTLMRGYGLKLWTFWQDLSQLQSCYPLDWPTFLNNCTTQQFFAPASPFAASQLNDYLAGTTPKPLSQMSADDVLVSQSGRAPIVLRRASYLSDRVFQGRYDPNPFYAHHPRPDPPRETNIVPFQPASTPRPHRI